MNFKCMWTQGVMTRFLISFNSLVAKIKSKMKIVILKISMVIMKKMCLKWILNQVQLVKQIHYEMSVSFKLRIMSNTRHGILYK